LLASSCVKINALMRGGFGDVTLQSARDFEVPQSALAQLVVSTPVCVRALLLARVDAYGRAKRCGMQTPFCKKRMDRSA